MSFAADLRWSLLATVCWMLAQHLPCVLASNVCLQVPPGGSCGEYELRYFYKIEDEECTEFHWEGCNATETTGNIFLTAEECIDTCGGAVTLPPGLPTDPPGNTIIPIVPTDPGSPPTGSSFNSAIHCFLTVDKGQAVENFGPFQRYFFNKSQQCEEFTFLGLGGNFNNFKDEEDCLDKCGHLTTTQPSVVVSSGMIPSTAHTTSSVIMTSSIDVTINPDKTETLIMPKVSSAHTIIANTAKSLRQTLILETSSVFYNISEASPLPKDLSNFILPIIITTVTIVIILIISSLLLIILTLIMSRRKRVPSSQDGATSLQDNLTCIENVAYDSVSETLKVPT